MNHSTRITFLVILLNGFNLLLARKVEHVSDTSKPDLNFETSLPKPKFDPNQQSGSGSGDSGGSGWNFGAFGEDENSDEGKDSSDGHFSWPTIFEQGSQSLEDLLKTFFNGMQGGADNGDDNDGFGGFNLPGDFGSLFGFGSDGGFGVSNQQWWKGPNVCTHENTTEIETSDEDDDLPDFLGIFRGSSRQCRNSGDTYTCSERVRDEDGNMVMRTVVYQCCNGFGRENRRAGCTKVLNLKSLLDTLKAMNLTTFVENVDKAQLVKQLNQSNFTLFVPTNDANAGEAENIQTYIVPGLLPANAFRDEQVVNTLDNGTSVRFNQFTDGSRRFWTVNCVPVSSANVRATNGIIHTINGPITPATQTIVEIVDSNPQLSTLKSLLSEDMRQQLSDPKKHYTLLAFTNNAFNALPSTFKTRLQNKDTCSQGLVQAHLLRDTLCSAAMRNNLRAPNVLGERLSFSRKGNVTKVGNATIIASDLMAKNSLVHLIDQILVSPNMLKPLEAVEMVYDNMLAKLVDENELQTRISQLGNVTIFVPPSEALKNATDISPSTLLNHFVNQSVELSARKQQLSVVTLDNQQLNISASSSLGPIRIPFSVGIDSLTVQGHVGCANIIRSNVKVCGGVLHFIDRILEKPTKTILEVLQSNPAYSKFLKLYTAVTQNSTATDANFQGTVLVPSNDALDEAMTVKEANELEKNADRLKKFVQNHMLSRKICCNQFNDNLLQRGLRTLSGESLQAFNFGPVKRVGRANIVACDQLATDGIVHEVDQPFKNVRNAGPSRPGIFGVFPNIFESFGGDDDSDGDDPSGGDHDGDDGDVSAE